MKAQFTYNVQYLGNLNSLNFSADIITRAKELTDYAKNLRTTSLK